MKRLLPVFVIFGFFVFGGWVMAFERGLVKGQSTGTMVSDFKLSYGPGFFLPSSPLYFLDLWVNKIKIKLAPSPSEEARRRGMVAAERLAELKIALEANNPRGIDVALSNLTEHLDGIKKVFIKEKAAGRDASKLAEEILQNLNDDEEALRALLLVSEEVMAKKLEAVETALLEAQDSVIEGLPKLTREKARLKKLTKEALKRARKAEKEAGEVSQKVKEALKEANRTLKLRFGDEGPTPESLVLDDALLRPFEESIEQAEKMVEEASKAASKVEEIEDFDPEKAMTPWEGEEENHKGREK